MRQGEKSGSALDMDFKDERGILTLGDKIVRRFFCP